MAVGLAVQATGIQQLRTTHIQKGDATAAFAGIIAIFFQIYGQTRACSSDEGFHLWPRS
jgi:hypothetical protein